jgi:hypothetical protein
MKVSKTILALVAAIAAAGFTPHKAQATQITGQLNLHGQAKFTPNTLGGATSVTSFKNVTVDFGSTGAFSGISVGTSVAMSSSYIFSPSSGTPTLWSVGGFTFDLQTSSVVMQNNNFLSISGTGTIFGPSFDPTPGVWTFQSTSSNGHPGPDGYFNFTASTSAVPTPDSGMTVALLGAGLIGLAAFRAKFAKS